MHLPKQYFRPLPLAYKVMGVVLIAIFLLIGLAGLILPIIPGILFLLLALYVLTRISRRAAAYAHSKPWLHRPLSQMNAADKLSISERVRLGLLVIARGAVNAAEWCVDALQSKAKR